MATIIQYLLNPLEALSLQLFKIVFKVLETIWLLLSRSNILLQAIIQFLLKPIEAILLLLFKVVFKALETIWLLLFKIHRKH